MIASKYAFVLIDRELEFVNALNSRKLKMAYSTICFVASEIVIPNCCSGACKTDTDEKIKDSTRVEIDGKPVQELMLHTHVSISSSSASI